MFLMKFLKRIALVFHEAPLVYSHESYQVGKMQMSEKSREMNKKRPVQFTNMYIYDMHSLSLYMYRNFYRRVHKYNQLGQLEKPIFSLCIVFFLLLLLLLLKHLPFILAIKWLETRVLIRFRLVRFPWMSFVSPGRVSVQRHLVRGKRHIRATRW